MEQQIFEALVYAIARQTEREFYAMPRFKVGDEVRVKAGSPRREHALTELGDFKGKGPRRKQGESELEKKVAKDLRELGLMEGCQTQYRFHPTRKWLIDFAFPERRVALEVNGGTYLQGSKRAAHSRGPRQRKDYCKWSELSLMGWTVLLVDSADVRAGVHVERVLRALGKS